jgi:hypothetical protein
LSRRLTGFLFTLISIIAINSWQLLLPGFEYDNSFCLAAAKNLSEGHGYSIKMADTADFSKFHYEPFNKFPPGYSWLLVLIHKILNTDWIRTVYILNALGLTALVLIFRKILFQLEYPPWIIHLSVLYFGFLHHAFLSYNNADIFGLVFYLLGLSFLLGGIKSGINQERNIFLSVIFFVLAVCQKYLYIPLSFVPVLATFIFGYRSKEKAIQRTAIKSFFVLSLILFSLLIIQYIHSGQAFYINPSQSGFYPDQLIRLAPIIPATFLNFDFLNMQAGLYTHVSYPALRIFWSVVNIGCICWLAYICIKHLKYKKLQSGSFRSFYAILVFLFTIVLFGYLSLLTVIKSKHYPMLSGVWVYAEEMRYFAVFSVFLIQFAIFLILNPGFFSVSGKMIFNCFMIFILVEEVSHGAYYCLKQILIKKDYGICQREDLKYFKLLELTKRTFAINKNLVVCSNAAEFVNMCSLAGVYGLYDIERLKAPIPTTSDMTLIIIVHQKIPNSFVPLVVTESLKPQWISEEICYYMVKASKSLNF